MREKTILHKIYVAYCHLNGYTRKEGRDRLGVSKAFLSNILTFTDPCPEWLIDNMVTEFQIDKEVLGLIFGRYPVDWLQFLKEKPGRARKLIHGILVKEGYREKTDKLCDQGRSIRVIKETADRNNAKSFGSKN